MTCSYIHRPTLPFEEKMSSILVQQPIASFFVPLLGPKSPLLLPALPSAFQTPGPIANLVGSPQHTTLHNPQLLISALSIFVVASQLLTSPFDLFMAVLFDCPAPIIITNVQTKDKYYPSGFGCDHCCSPCRRRFAASISICLSSSVFFSAKASISLRSVTQKRTGSSSGVAVAATSFLPSAFVTIFFFFMCIHLHLVHIRSARPQMPDPSLTWDCDPCNDTRIITIISVVMRPRRSCPQK